jgi:molybdopterin-guanine dinucleotide biosynthesis protein A
MGSPKHLIQYHGRTQIDWLISVMRPFCERVIVSGAADRVRLNECFVSDDPSWGTIGPAAGVLSASAAFPHGAWLVAGCDYPFARTETFEKLLRHRSRQHDAVAFVRPDTGSFEPLLALYEPSFIRLLKERVATGDSSLLRALEKATTNGLVPEDSNWLNSIDTPSEREKALATFRNFASDSLDCN